MTLDVRSRVGRAVQAAVARPAPAPAAEEPRACDVALAPLAPKALPESWFKAKALSVPERIALEAATSDLVHARRPVAETLAPFLGSRLAMRGLYAEIQQRLKDKSVDFIAKDEALALALAPFLDGLELLDLTRGCAVRVSMQVLNEMSAGQALALGKVFLGLFDQGAAAQMPPLRGLRTLCTALCAAKNEKRRDEILSTFAAREPLRESDLQAMLTILSTIEEAQAASLESRGVPVAAILAQLHARGYSAPWRNETPRSSIA